MRLETGGLVREGALAPAPDQALDGIVDIDGLRAAWAGAEPSAMTFLLLQQCWLVTEGHADG